jgi:fibronectin type 3 domain-containing protein
VIARPAGTRFTDTDVVNGVTYYYEVAPLNASGAGNPSAPVAATPQAAYAPPPAPTGLKAASANGSVQLSWTASARADHYSVRRATGVNGPYTAIANTAAPSYSDASVTVGKQYYYAVAAVNAYGTSVNSAPAGVLAK